MNSKRKNDNYYLHLNKTSLDPETEKLYAVPDLIKINIE